MELGLTNVVYGWISIGGVIACAVHFSLRDKHDPGLDLASWLLCIVLWPVLLALLLRERMM